MAIAMVEERAGSDQPAVGPMRSWGTVVAFMLVYIVSFIDRQALAIVVDPLRLSLGLSDTQIGLLQGFIFTTVLVLAGVPMAFLVDRFSRKRVLIGCMVLWGLATMSCGFASNFLELAAARMGLALAEAVVPIAAMSTIGDLFARHKVNQAAAVFTNGPYFGNGAAMLLSGWFINMMHPLTGTTLPIMGKFEDWRGLFVALGVLTLVVAFAMAVYLKEPLRRELSLDKHKIDSGSFVSFFRGHIGFILTFCLFASSISFVGYSLYAWTATMMIRVHAMEASDVGLALGIIFLITAIPGTALAAWLGSRCPPEKALQHLVKVMLGFFVALILSAVAMALSPTKIILPMVALCMLVYAAAHAGLLTPVQLIAPNNMRGRMAAVTIMLAGIPAGLGPVVVGYLSDHFFTSPGSLGLAMAVAFGGIGMIGSTAGLFTWMQAQRLERTPTAEWPRGRWSDCRQGLRRRSHDLAV